MNFRNSDDMNFFLVSFNYPTVSTKHEKEIKDEHSDFCDAEGTTWKQEAKKQENIYRCTCFTLNIPYTLLNLKCLFPT